MLNLKAVLRARRKQLKRWLVRAARFVPVSSKYFGSPKGFYATSQEYVAACQAKGLSGTAYATFLPASVSKRNPLPPDSGPGHESFACRETHADPETFVVTVPNGRVLGEMGTIITHDDRLLFDVSQQFGIGRDVAQAKSHRAFRYFKLPRCQRTSETVAVLATHGGQTYFHWLTDALPRLEILRRALPGGLEGIDKFVVNEGIPAIAESLELLGIPTSKLIFCDSRTHLQAKSLIVPSLPGVTGNLPVWACKFLRDSFLSQATETDTPPRIYISRSRAALRRVVNEAEVLHRLARHGFKPIWLEDLSFRRQIALFANAEAIIAPHGAGLTNLMWCRPNASVLEFFPPSYSNACFWIIADQVGTNYFYMQGEEDAPPYRTQPVAESDAMTVSIVQLETMLARMLNR